MQCGSCQMMEERPIINAIVGLQTHLVIQSLITTTDWSNFEIADMDFWRSEAYMKYFEYLDSKGGFYYERWGDAPVHSIAASLLLHKEKIHFFDQIGYRHHPFEHCPQGWTHRQGQCKCLQSDNFDYNGCV